MARSSFTPPAPDPEFDLSRLSTVMAGAGVRLLYAKRLAANDNSKNQVYLGHDFQALNILPFKRLDEEKSEGKAILKASLDFTWIDERGSMTEAPGAQLILYPQYPEVRLSGFLKGVRNAPSKLMASRDAGRVLFFGIREDRRIVGHVVPASSAVLKQLQTIQPASQIGVFEQIPLLLGTLLTDPRAALLAELKRIHLLGWIRSKHLAASGRLEPCEAPNCGGYTLEAELQIRPNSRSEPDFQGWEIKQHGVSSFSALDVGVLTLMTPEPAAGFYHEKGVEAFIRRFGYLDLTGRPDRMNFGGVHRAGERHARTGLTLTVSGFDPKRGTFDPTKGLSLLTDSGEAAATWPYSRLVDHWSRKHAQAAYVPSQCKDSHGRFYRYGPIVRLGEGTDFQMFLRAIESGAIYYDPGIKLESMSSAKPRTKRRSQFRVKSRDLQVLYQKMTSVPV